MAQHFRNSVYAASICYFITIIFLILVVIGNTSNKTGLRDLYFFQLELANIIPLDAPNAQLLNSVARSLGLHDFYQVGLWNFCEGYNGEGIVHCSEPQRFYWFNPVDVLMNELLAGAKIALPTEVITILDLLKIGQQTIFGFFVTGLVLNFLLMLLSPMVLRSWAWSVPIVAFSFISGLLINAATILATIISVAAKYALTLQSELNIKANISSLMIASMWIAAVFSSVAFFLHSAVACCCHRHRRKHQERTSSESAAATSSPATPETTEMKKKKFSVPDFVRKRKPGANRRSQGAMIA